MKINISKQGVYLLFSSILLLFFVLLFSFIVLIPQGKDYRKQRNKINKDVVQLNKDAEFSDSILEKLKKLESDNAHVITAFDNKFDPDKFEQQHRSHFNSLKLSAKKEVNKEDNFVTYEVNATSSINSPQSFYAFLDAINKSDWIIEVDFPINFKRIDEMISSSFTMKIYSIKKDLTK